MRAILGINLILASVLLGCGADGFVGASLDARPDQQTVDAADPLPDGMVPPGQDGGLPGQDAAGSDGMPMTDSGPPAPDCMSYCLSIQTWCTGTDQQYPDVPTCMNACKLLPAGNPWDMSGNSVGCRINHSEKVKSNPQDSANLCNSAGLWNWNGKFADCAMSGGSTEAFCLVSVAACTGIYAQFSSYQDCIAKAGPPSGWTLASSMCRQGYLMKILQGAPQAVYCNDTGNVPAGSGNICGQ